MGERFASGVKSAALLALLVVVGWGCPVASGQPSGSDAQSERAASPPQALQQPASPAPLPAAEPEPATPTAVANTVTITTPDGALIEYSKDPDTVVVMMTWEGGGVLERKKPLPPLLRIYGDGRAVVRGRWQLQLTEGELGEVLGCMALQGVLDLDTAAMERLLDDIDSQRGIPKNQRHSERSRGASGTDIVPLLIQVNLTGYRPAKNLSGGAAPLNKTIRWINVQGDALAYPEVPHVVGLAAAHKRLMALVDCVEAQHTVTIGGKE